MRRPVVKAAAVRVRPAVVIAGPHAQAPEDVSGPETGGEAQVHLRRSGDLIEAIEVVCSCGRHLEFQCLYDAGARSTPDSGAGEGKESP